MGSTSNSSTLTSSFLSSIVSRSRAYSLRTITNCTRTKGAIDCQSWLREPRLGALSSRSVSASVPLSILVQCHREEQIKSSLPPIFQPTLGESLTLGSGWSGQTPAARFGDCEVPNPSSPPLLPGPLGSTLPAAKDQSHLSRPLSPRFLPGPRAELERNRRPVPDRDSPHSSRAGGGGEVGGLHAKVGWTLSSQTATNQASKLCTQLVHFFVCFFLGPDAQGAPGGGSGGRGGRARRGPPACSPGERSPSRRRRWPSLRNVDLSLPLRDLDREISIFCLGSKTWKRSSSRSKLPALDLLRNAWREGLGRQALGSGSRGSRARPARLALAPRAGPGSPRVFAAGGWGHAPPGGQTVAAGEAPWAAVAGWPFSPSAPSRSSRTLHPKTSRAKEGDAGPGRALTVGGGVGALRHFAPAFTAKVAGNPFCRARDNEKELRGIQVEKSVNTRTTHSWGWEVYVKLCVVLSLSGKRGYYYFSPWVWRNFPFRRVILTDPFQLDIRLHYFLTQHFLKCPRDALLALPPRKVELFLYHLGG